MAVLAVFLCLAPSAWAADNTTTAVSCSPNPLSVGTSTTCTAIVTDTTAASSPTGTVTFSGTGSSFTPSNPCTLAPASSNTASCSATFTPSSLPQTVTATYTPSGSFNSSPSPGTTTLLAATSTTVGCSPNPDNVNGPTTCLVTVVGNSTNGAPIGTVTFNNGGGPGNFYSSNPCTLSAISSSASQCTVGYTPYAAGNQSIGASYTPTGASNGTYGASFGFSNLSVTGSPPVQVSCLPNPVSPHAPTSCTATVTGNSSYGAPSGTVTFGNGGASGTFSGNPCTLSAISSSASQCSVSYTPTAPGTQTISATYNPVSGSPYVANGASTTLTSGYSTTTSISSSLNPSALGKEVTFTATVSPDPGSGTVSFASGGVLPGCSAVPVTLDGHATCTVTLPAAGRYPVQASFSGTSQYWESVSPVLDQVVANPSSPHGTKTSVFSSRNPVGRGRQVTLTATISPTPDGGRVKFLNNGNPIDACHSVPVSGGEAKCKAQFRVKGLHTIRAVYSGDGNFAGSQSDTLTEIVRKNLGHR